MKSHLWQGVWIDDKALGERIGRMGPEIEAALAVPFAINSLLDACESLGAELRAKGPVHKQLQDCLSETGEVSQAEIVQTLAAIAAFLDRASLETKLLRELGSRDPFNPTRIDFRQRVFESWAPLGLLVHVTPTNAFSVGALSVIEGLLSGNVNFLKTSASDSLFAQIFLKSLCDHDASGRLAQRVFACRISSKNKAQLEAIFAQADGVAAWGGEEAIAGVRKMVGPGTRLIEWGPKISFAYVAASAEPTPVLFARLARACCELEQQACSSPQCIYLETTDREKLRAFARGLAVAFEKESPKIARIAPEGAELGEVTTVSLLSRLESCLEGGGLIEADDKSWRVLIEYKAGLRASPLYRSVWLKPLPREKIVQTLRPLRAYLQTVGLESAPSDYAELEARFVRAGLLRVCTSDGMTASYTGEPHDGVYALQRYCRRVSLQSDAGLDGIAAISDLEPPLPSPAKKVPVLSKESYQARTVDPRFAELFFKSGGSSGDPKLSIFTWEDYSFQMKLAAEGLFAAGLDPARDRCMNLFFGGGLYGGFISFFSILEHLRAVQFPMAAQSDLTSVAKCIVDNGVNVLLGMPSYIIQLLHAQDELLSKSRTIRKIFYGGEHFSEVARHRFKDRFGIEVIRSASYGSVDAGPLAFQCPQSHGGVHHLHHRLQQLEILDPSEDRPVAGTEPGRLVFSSRVRKGQLIERYEIGDTGRWVAGDCPCGRKSPRFELLGRHGDVFRCGANYLNYRRFEQILADRADYAAELQIVVAPGHPRERLLLRLRAGERPGAAEARALLLKHYPELHESVVDDKLLDFDIEELHDEAFERTAGSGKLRRLIDRRLPGGRA